MDYTINKYIINTDNSARFVLGFDNSNPLIVIGVNPSTADDNKPDATIRRIIGYTQRNGFDGFLMLNVYPQRATLPRNLSKECDTELHKQNVQHITQLLSTHSRPTILAAFGDTILIRPYLKSCFADIVFSVLELKPNWLQIGNPTKKGNPRHPSRGHYQPFQEFAVHQYIK